jgi:hypothetical protein
VARKTVQSPTNDLPWSCSLESSGIDPKAASLEGRVTYNKTNRKALMQFVLMLTVMPNLFAIFSIQTVSRSRPVKNSRDGHGKRAD